MKLFTVSHVEYGYNKTDRVHADTAEQAIVEMKRLHPSSTNFEIVEVKQSVIAF